MTQTFYDVLGVSPDASTEAIRAAYRERLKESHPDLSDDDDAGEKTKRIVRARDVLTDEDERRRYDRVGHDEFVGDGDAGVDEADVSDAAAAARRAGWGSDESADASADASDSEPDADRRKQRADARRRARDRRRRERAASERVERETDRTSERENGSAASADGGTAGSSAGATASSVSGSARSWNGSGGFSVRQEYHAGSRRRRLFPSARSVTLLAIAFVLYPLMLFSALFPPFPLVVNVVVGCCTIFLVGYLQSVPQVGVAVFGAWSLLVPVAFVATGVPLTGLVGVVALTATWLPLGLSVLTFTMVRP